MRWLVRLLGCKRTRSGWRASLFVGEVGGVWGTGARVARGLLKGCSRVAQGLLKGCARVAQGLLKGCSRVAQGLLKVCSRVAACYYLVRLLASQLAC